jgi:rod shape-determining protein MreB
METAMQAGASKAYLIEEPLAAALGAGIDISQPYGSMVIDIGGGTMDIAVLSLNGIVVSNSVRVGGDKLNEAIIRYLKKEYNLLIGETTAEEIKINIATVYEGSRNESMEARGRDLVSGLPKTVVVTSAQMRVALAELSALIVDCVKDVLERTPPELSADIVERGIVLTGGGALLDGLDRLLYAKTGIPIHLADDMLSCVALGAGKALASLDKLRGSLVALQKTGLHK